MISRRNDIIGFAEKLAVAVVSIKPYNSISYVKLRVMGGVKLLK